MFGQIYEMWYWQYVYCDVGIVGVEMCDLWCQYEGVEVFGCVQLDLVGEFVVVFVQFFGGGIQGVFDLFGIFYQLVVVGGEFVVVVVVVEQLVVDLFFEVFYVL